ncbi:aldolase [Marinicrinis lubricantis]|uniref:Aldolase n=1 Tax=Marinicrinis lubricantis TaxID=2086470 RepID=A0ABW1IJU3_9BACL
MIPTVKKMVYTAFGMRICSDVPMPELPQADGLHDDADMMIEKSDLTALWDSLGLEEEDNFVQIDQRLLFKIPDTALFCIQEGTKITVSPMSGADEHKIRLFCLGTCMGAILLQRRVLPLHGSAVAIDGKAYAIVGHSGAGKSTLAAAFLQKGYHLLSDDVIAVTASANSAVPVVIPAYPQQKLWEESIVRFGMETDRYAPLYEEVSKYAVPVSSSFQTEALPLAGIFELVKSEQGGIALHAVQGLERLHTIFMHTYRNFLVFRLGLAQWHFTFSANLVKHIVLYQLIRPDQGEFTAHDLASLILDTVRKGE